MVKIQHAGGRGDKPFRVAFAAFLGDSGRYVTRVPECVRKVTFFLVFQGPRVSTVDKFRHLSTGRSFSFAGKQQA